VLKVAVCEDDTALRSVLVRALRQAGHETVTAGTGSEAVRGFPAARPDVVILDIGLPDADGRDVCLALRGAGLTAPVLMLTAKDGVHDKVSGFEAGADDYLTKPFELAELYVRVQALARRGRPETAGSTTLRLDPSRHSIVAEDREVSLTPTEYRLLARLMSNPGEVIRRNTLVAAAWPMGAAVSDNTLDSYLRRLRVKVAELGDDHEIRTTRGVGYSWR
jgi:two-component system OmpR family response regulator